LSRPVEETRELAEFRADKDSPGFSGYAARFNSVDSHGSAFARSAFRKTLRERGDRILVLFNHDTSKVIGKADELRTDAKGLKFNARVAEDSFWGKEVMTLVRADILTGMSFGFSSIKERPGLPTDNLDLSSHRGAKPEEVRFIEEVRLKELSIAPFPSNETARLDSYRSADADEVFGELLESLRNMDVTREQIEELTEQIRCLQDALDDPEPPSTPVEESRHALDIEIDLLLMELGTV
jgi:HK97 family phage prohead protease